MDGRRMDGLIGWQAFSWVLHAYRTAQNAFLIESATSAAVPAPVNVVQVLDTWWEYER